MRISFNVIKRSPIFCHQAGVFTLFYSTLTLNTRLKLPSAPPSCWGQLEAAETWSTDEERQSFTTQLQEGSGICSGIFGVPVPVGQPHAKDLEGESALLLPTFIRKKAVIPLLTSVKLKKSPIPPTNRRTLPAYSCMMLEHV